MIQLNITVSVEKDIWVDLFCSCGEALKGKVSQSDNEKLNEKLYVIVEPCKKCLEESKAEGDPAFTH